MAETEILSNARNVFAKLKEEKKIDYKLPQIELYKKAQELEKKTEDFYRQKSEEVEDEHQKAMFLKCLSG